MIDSHVFCTAAGSIALAALALPKPTFWQLVFCNSPCNLNSIQHPNTCQEIKESWRLGVTHSMEFSQDHLVYPPSNSSLEFPTSIVRQQVCRRIIGPGGENMKRRFSLVEKRLCWDDLISPKRVIEKKAVQKPRSRRLRKNIFLERFHVQLYQECGLFESRTIELGARFGTFGKWFSECLRHHRIDRKWISEDPFERPRI